VTLEEIKRTRELASLFSKFFLDKMVPVGLTVCINALTVSIDLTDMNQRPNSNIIIQRSGTGKSTLLRALHEANQEHTVVLPSKMFESSVFEFPGEYFQNKVWIHDDLTTVFQGASTKQRQQLQGFFVDILDRGVYERHDRSGSKPKRVEGNISFQTAISEENFSKYGRETYYSTLIPERLVPIGVRFTPEDMQKLTYKISSESRSDKLVRGLKLPFKDEPVKVRIDKGLLKDLRGLAFGLQVRTSMAMSRAYLYLIKMAKGHALLNDRDYVTKADIDVLKYLLPAHRYPRPSTLEERVREIIAKEVFNSGEISSSEIYEKVREIPEFQNVTDRAIRKVFDSIKRDVPTKRGENNQIVFYVNLEP